MYDCDGDGNVVGGGGVELGWEKGTKLEKSSINGWWIHRTSGFEMGWEKGWRLENPPITGWWSRLTSHDPKIYHGPKVPSLNSLIRCSLRKRSSVNCPQYFWWDNPCLPILVGRHPSHKVNNCVKRSVMMMRSTTLEVHIPL